MRDCAADCTHTLGTCYVKLRDIVKMSHVPEALALLDECVNLLASELPRPERVLISDGDFVWRYPEDSTQVLIVCKCVRLSTSLVGAWHLATMGHTTEAGSLLRQVGDFSAEIWFILEGMLRGDFTSAQTKFIAHFYDRVATSVEEYLEKEKVYYVSRNEIGGAERRLAEAAGLDAQALHGTTSFLSYGLNKYVHGAYETAMELYHGEHDRFMILGVNGPPQSASLRFAASKATEACLAIGAAASVLSHRDVKEKIAAFLRRADDTLPEFGPAPVNLG